MLPGFQKVIDNSRRIGLVLIGFFVALFSVGVGIGGGTMFVFIFVSIFKYDFKNAAGLSQSAIIPITLIGSICHFMFSHGNPPLKYFVWFIPMCMLGTIIGCNIMNKWKVSWLKFVFSCFLLIASLRMMHLFDIPAIMFSNLNEITAISKLLLVTSFGVMVGISATLLGIGCGLLIVPFFVIAMNLDIHEAIQLSLTTMFFLTVTATVTRNSRHSLKCYSLKSLIISSLAGAVTGAMISNALPLILLRQIFAISLLLIACGYMINLLFQFFRCDKHMDPVPARLEGR